MKRIIQIITFSLLAASVHAQNVDYAKKYEMLVSRLGPAGVGVETLLDNWKQADSADVDMLSARISYYLAKSRSTEVVTRPSKTYLAQKPILSLKDSTGNCI